jgi:hypothetical protein
MASRLSGPKLLNVVWANFRVGDHSAETGTDTFQNAWDRIGSTVGRYSFRSATTGSTRMARSAGR